MRARRSAVNVKMAGIRFVVEWEVGLAARRALRSSPEHAQNDCAAQTILPIVDKRGHGAVLTSLCSYRLSC